MIDLYRPDQVQQMDQRAFDRGVDPAALMDAAARHLACGILELAADRGQSVYGLRVTLLCGKGNNGGDGLAAARHLLARGVDARAVLLGDPDALGSGPQREFQALQRAGGRILTPADWGGGDGADTDRAGTDRAGTDAARPGRAGTKEAGDETASDQAFAAQVRARLDVTDVAVDCLLGTGATGEPRGLAAVAVSLLRTFHASGGAVVACDLPSGVDAGTGRVPGQAVTADLTVTLGAHKQGLWLHPAATHVGRVVLGEIGVVDDAAHPVATVLQARDMLDLAPPPGARSHKRSRGVVVIYAGSPDMVGAAILAARGALGAGAGLVTIATPSSAAHRMAGLVPEAMLRPLPDDADGIVEVISDAADGADVLAIGPGLGLADHTQQAVRRLVTAPPATIVLDADGINAFRDHADMLAASEHRPESRQLVLTPHAKEMGRLAGLSGHGVHARRTEVAIEQAARCGATVVAKGPRSVIAAPDGRVWINPTGGPGLATGGTGDVLTGVTSALLAQRPEPASVAAAVYLHGRAGDLAAARRSARATTAGVVADHLAAAALELGI